MEFDDGLFAHSSSRLSAYGRRTLSEWGRLLHSQAVRVTVLGNGVAVAGGLQTGGSTIGIARASTAVETLATASGLPLTAFTVAAADQTAGPYPTTSADGAAKDGTVSLLVTPKA